MTGLETRLRQPGKPLRYAELTAATNFSFLHGASHPEEIAFAAARNGLYGFSVTDRNSLAGVVRAHSAAKETETRYVVGCRLVFMDETPDIFAWPRDREAYGRLSRMLTVGNRRAPKGECHLGLSDLLRHGDGLFLAPRLQDEPLGQEALEAGARLLGQLAERFPGFVRLGAAPRYGPSDRRRLFHLKELADREGVPLLAMGDVLYHDPARRALQDVLTCIRDHVTLDEAGRRLQKNAERHLRTAENMAWLFRDCSEAVAASVDLIDAIDFRLDDLKYEYPEESTGESATPQAELERLTARGIDNRYPDGAPEKVLKAVRHELGLIADLNYAPYFLTVYDIVRFARSRGILCQGRGSAANSAVCFCLGITEVDPDRADLLFERFISPERREPPDIDVDFEHERREEVIQYVYQKYGRDRAGLAATVITYRSRSAVREVGKAFGLSEDAVSALASNIWGWSNRTVSDAEAKRAGLDPSDPLVAQVLALSQEIIGFPRHLSQHVGGFVITRGRLDGLAPVQNAAMDDRTIIEWDKDDLDALGILKIDVLALGMLTCIRKAFDLLQSHYGLSLTLAGIPAEDSKVYDMICRADTLGVFQIESRAQMSMLPRLKPRSFYDLVIEVAIVRPGPIQGDMVHPYLRRRQGLEDVHYPSKELEAVLKKTLGVPLFQEQAMQIAIVAADFTPAEADRLRRAMATFRRVGTIGTFQQKMIDGMVANGYEAEFAERCFRQIEGFGEYGFPESHAASFALLVYASCWLKCFYPDVFCAALLNSQPMGFYAPAQIVRDAREHGVTVRAPDINASDWDTTLEPGDRAGPRIDRRHHDMRSVILTDHAVRLGFRRIKGFSEADAAVIVAERGDGYRSIRDLWLRTGLSKRVLERLGRADALRSLSLDRREALWEIKGLDEGAVETRLPLFDNPVVPDLRPEPATNLPAMPEGEHVIQDYRSLSLSLKAHPLSFVRDTLRHRGFSQTGALVDWPDGKWIRLAGLVLVRQRPGSAKGVVFATLEDETGIANVIVWPKVLEKYRPIVLGARCVGVRGRVQSESGVIHVVADHLEDLTSLLTSLSEDAADIDGLARADEVKRPQEDIRQKIKPRSRLARLVQEAPELARDFKALSKQKDLARRTGSVLPKGRNFH
ncbi:MAG: error-prone DNA polymerase [Pseudomonadota bacterium]